MKMTDVGKFRRLLAVFEYDAEDLSAFFDLWLDNHAGQYDLNWFISQPHPLSKEQREEILCNQLSYLNALYAGRLHLDFNAVRQFQFSILIYAVEHRKKHFLELVNQNSEVFLSLGRYSLLFEPGFCEHCNINSLTLKNLKASDSVNRSDSFFTLLEEGQQYTFEEMYQLYRTGSQRECLLAAFDSNKKIVLVKKDEAVVARACLRLTKGAFQKPPAVDFSFADLSQENMDIGKPVTSEKPVLFLESIYTFGLNDIEKEEVMKLAVSLTTQKAAELGVVAVLARRYLGCYERDEYVLAPFYVYISKSKNGWQYLDSLGGAAYTSAKEEYVEHPFLVMQTAMHQAEANSRNEVYYTVECAGISTVLLEFCVVVACQLHPLGDSRITVTEHPHIELHVTVKDVLNPSILYIELQTDVGNLVILR